MPRHNEPVITIITDYYGMEPRIIEEIVTRPIERALKEIKGINSFHSHSSKGRSKILIYLSPNEDVDKKVVVIYDSMRNVADMFPVEVQEPRIFKYNTDDKPLMIVSLTPKGFSTNELYFILEHRIKPQILALRGIADVEITGIAKEEYFIEQRHENLVRLTGDYEKIFNEIVKNNVSLPLGRMTFGNSLIPVSFPNKYRDLIELPQHTYNVNEKEMFGYDLFSIVKRNREPDRISLINNKEVLILYIYKRDFSNILEIDRGVQRLLRKWGHLFIFEEIHNQVKLFKKLLRQLAVGICLACFCILLITLLFFRNFFYAGICILTIPLCFAGTSLVLKIFSKSVNIMSLSGLIVGIGTCVDSTIIVIDTIRQNVRTDVLESEFVQSVQKIHKPIFCSTFTTIIVFFPLFFLYPGKISLYADFALSFSSMLVISYIVSIFLIPAIFKRVATHKKLWQMLCVNGQRTFFFTGRLKFSFLRYIINIGFNNAVICLCVFFIITGACAYLLFTREHIEVSPLKENEYEVYFDFKPGYTAQYKYTVISEIGKKIASLKLPMMLISRLDNDKATFFFQFAEQNNLYRVRVQRLKEYFLALTRDDGFFHLQREAYEGNRSIIIYFFGDNLNELNSFVEKVAHRISRFYGTREILKGYRTGKPEIQFHLDLLRMRYYNLDTTHVVRFLRYILYSPVIMKFYDGERVVDVRGNIKIKSLKKDNISAISIPTLTGEYISLNDFSTLKFSESHGSIHRKNGKRCITLDIRYEGMSEKEYLQHLFSFLNSLDFKDDFYYEVGKEIEEKKRSRAIFIGIICLACYLVYVVLGNVLKSFSYPFIIMLHIPSIFVGSFLYLRISNFGQSVPVHIALLMLTGLSVNTVIILLDEVLYFRQRGLKRSLLLGYSRKMRVIGMTVLTTIFSIIPVFLLATSTYFFKILAGIIFAGLLSSILLLIVIFPAFYIVFVKNQ